MNLPFADETLLARWISGELNEQERRQIEEHPRFEEWLRIVESSKHLRAPEYDAPANWQAIQSSKNTYVKSSGTAIRPLLKWAAAAAVIGLCLAIYLLRPATAAPEMAELSSSTGQMVQTLPDASTVRLNAASSIRYREDTWADERTLELEGEAFFEVEEGSRFLVQTDLGEVEVLGTSFNVYSRGDQLKVICFSGRVAVTNASGGRRELRPGQGTQLVGNRWLALNHMERGAPSWTTGSASFRNVTIPEVFQEIELQFGVTLNYSSLPARQYTGPLPLSSLEEALRVICPPLGLEFRILDTENVEISQIND